MSRYAAIAIALLAAAPAHGAASEPRVVPNPLVLQRHEGSFRLDATTPLVVTTGEPALTAARVLADRLGRTHGLRLRVVTTASTRGIAFEAAALAGAEAYQLDVERDRVRLRAATLAGFTHAATTLWQLLPPRGAGALELPALHIEDAPRFAWRGLMLDSARSYQSPEFILRFIDAMSAQKLNVLHWHLTDDQGWRLEIRKYPQLTRLGAWRRPAGDAALADIDPATHRPRLVGGYYDQDTVRRIVAYAAERAIQIVPEIDLPGHASAAIAAYPALAAGAEVPREVPADWGIYSNVYNLEEPTLAFLEDVLTEVIALFPGRYVHIGGDEVVRDHWRGSLPVQERMRALGIADVEHVQPWFTQRIGAFLAHHGRVLIGWDEILAGDLPPSATVMSWRGLDGAIAAAAKGHDTVLAPSPLLYFDHWQRADPAQPPGRGGVVSLEDVYRFEPMPEGIDPAQRHHVLGLEATLWSEHIRTEARMGWMAFPRAAAVAEVGWSQPARRDWDDFRRRLGAMPARYAALGMTYASSSFEPQASARDARRRSSAELELCTDSIALWLEDDAPVRGERARFLVDVGNPCWLWRGVRGDAASIEASVGQVPFNFQIGEDLKKMHLATPTTPEGELEVHEGTCDGKLLARLPLAPARRNEAVTRLPAARIASAPAPRDLCFRFAQWGVDPLWVLESVRIMEAP
jgi:hexosaminidase